MPIQDSHCWPSPIRPPSPALNNGRNSRRVPPLGPRLLLGEQGARELACANQNVVPARLQQAGQRFRHPDLEQALRHVLGRTRI